MRKNGMWIGVVGGMIVALLAAARSAQAWSHQGHIVMTRLAGLRIIADPTAPEDLKAFLKRHLQGDLADCRRLATELTVGADAKDYLTGLDGASTLPDRILDTPEGKNLIEPFGVPEAKLHFLDLEYFTKTPSYADDLSHRPRFSDVPRDVKDPRFKDAGFLPLRTAEIHGQLARVIQSKMFRKLNAAGERAVEAETLRLTGYLAHYLQDATQPHHGTIDYKSLSYLVGKVEGIQTRTTPRSDGSQAVSYSIDRTRNINPHGDLEFQLFENAAEPRKAFRLQYWEELLRELKRLDAQAAMPATAPAYDPFAGSLTLMLQSYDHLPLIGRAAQAAYAGGKFDPAAFFNHRGKGSAGEQSIVELIARQNALAVRAVEQAIRRAWVVGEAK